MFKHSAQRKLGQLLLDRHLISPQQLADAIAAQRQQAIPLGEILVQQHLISERQLARTLKWQSLLRTAMLVSSFSLAASPCLASEAQRMTQQFVNDIGGYTQPKHKTKKTKRFNEPEPSWLTELRSGPAAPIVAMVSGRYTGGVKSSAKGLRYKAKWSEDSLKLELRYQF